MERTVRSMVNAAFIGLLLFLFIVPPRYVNKVCGQMTALTAAAAERAIAGEDARDELGQLNRPYCGCFWIIRVWTRWARPSACANR